jgi:hypothetical protein
VRKDVGKMEALRDEKRASKRKRNSEAKDK